MCLVGRRLAVRRWQKHSTVFALVRAEGGFAAHLLPLKGEKIFLIWLQRARVRVLITCACERVCARMHEACGANRACLCASLWTAARCSLCGALGRAERVSWVVVHQGGCACCRACQSLRNEPKARAQFVPFRINAGRFCPGERVRCGACGRLQRANIFTPHQGPRLCVRVCCECVRCVLLVLVQLPRQLPRSTTNLAIV